ncbi:chorismate mutase [Xaviernesmea oryzae]|uniref:chorismate mutase n=1 Tax=Xaviernesmea oryzae TaxID=464029 RepID=A0A1Q9AS58_9HYPH|nr:chorismate mutase family protein [Xaviernesmea oryzae]OLP58257.1 chorismate mutase [Xaviernesmea oryzae]SEL44585.1 isochorismate pyruvate lyase [Xaviernesmea oryzae]
MKTPAECRTMPEIRQEIDRIDEALMRLFSERWGYIGRAAEIKREIGLKADIPARVDEVRRNARANAERHGLDPDFYDMIWEKLIRHAIAHERAALGERDE